MLAVFHACAEFMLSDGTKFTVGREKRNQFITIEKEQLEVLNDPLFQAMVDVGEIEIPEDARAKMAMEMDPLAGVDPEGKKVTVKNATKAVAKKAGAEGKNQVVEVKPETAKAVSANPLEG